MHFTSQQASLIYQARSGYTFIGFVRAGAPLAALTLLAFAGILPLIDGF